MGDCPTLLTTLICRPPVAARRHCSRPVIHEMQTKQTVRGRTEHWRTKSGCLIATQALFVIALSVHPATAQNAAQILEATYAERPKALQAAPLERQVQLYLHLMVRTEPPDMRLATVVAEAGPAIVPSILKAVQSTKEDYDLANLSLVLSIMQRSGAYNVAGDVALCTAFRTRANAMKHPTFRAIVTDELDRVRCPGGKP
jgi:hypothetical protein